MAVNPVRIETFLRERTLNFERRYEDGCHFWIKFYSEGIGLCIRLEANGGRLLFRSLPLIDLDCFTPPLHRYISRMLMRRSTLLQIGRYLGQPKVVFEISMPIVDNEVITNSQLHRCLEGIVSEISSFDERLRSWLMQIPVEVAIATNADVLRRTTDEDFLWN